MNGFFRNIAAALPVLSLMVLTGCAAPDLPSDITLDELEMKMAKAMDPAQKYRNASAYFQRQNIEEEGFWETKYQLVEVKFQRPDKFKLSYYEKNRPISEILSVGSKAWFIDYKNSTVKELTGLELDKLKVMIALGHPDTDYDKLFAKVDLFLTRIDGKDHYKLVCYPALENANPITIYVDRKEMLPRRLELKVNTPDGVKKSVSNIENYQIFDQIKVPALTRVVEAHIREYLTRVVEYQLNAHFREDEFKLPEFDPVLMEVEKRKHRR